MSTCPFCGETRYQKKNGTVNGKQRFKCLYCSRNYTIGVEPYKKPPHKPRKLNTCLQCGKETPNPKFCSIACASIHNLKKMPPKKKKQRFCKHCGKPTESRYNICSDCNPNNVDWSKRTVGEIQYAAKYQVSAALRSLARRAYKKSNRTYACQNCGYDKHVEICHIRGIQTFPDETPVSVVSGIDNLVALCPNCHWEFDHGLLTIEEIERRVRASSDASRRNG